MNIRRELLLCDNSFDHFCTHLQIKAVDHDRQCRYLTPLKLHNYQSRLVRDIEANRFVVGTKFRQGGFTATTMLYALWKSMFCVNQKILMVFGSERELISSAACDLKDIVREMPEWLKPNMGTWNDHTWEFEDTSSKLLFLSAGAMPTSHGRFTHLIFDEAAFMRGKMQSLFEELYPELLMDGKVIAISSPNGKQGWFYHAYWNATRGLNKYTAYSVGHWEHPEYTTSEWLDKMRANLGDKGFRQEVLCEFLDVKTSD